MSNVLHFLSSSSCFLKLLIMAFFSYPFTLSSRILVFMDEILWWGTLRNFTEEREAIIGTIF